MKEGLVVEDEKRVYWNQRYIAKIVDVYGTKRIKFVQGCYFDVDEFLKVIEEMKKVLKE